MLIYIVNKYKELQTAESHFLFRVNYISAVKITKILNANHKQTSMRIPYIEEATASDLLTSQAKLVVFCHIQNIVQLGGTRVFSSTVHVNHSC